MKKFTFIISWICGICAACFLNLYQPFMELWVGKDLMLGFSAVICFSIYFFVQEVNRLLNLYKDSGGIWHEDRFRPLVTALTNLLLNLILVNFWGIYGVLLSTVLATLLVGMPWLLHNLFSTLFDKEMLKPYLLKLLSYVGYSLAVCVFCVFICSFVTFGSLWCFIVRGIICMVLVNLIFFVIYRKTNEFRETISLINVITKNRIPVIKNYGNKQN